MYCMKNTGLCRNLRSRAGSVFALYCTHGPMLAKQKKKTNEKELHRFLDDGIEGKEFATSCLRLVLLHSCFIPRVFVSSSFSLFN